MKKWLIWCLTVLAMVCLIPGIVLKAAAETVPVHCAFCGIREEREARRYEKYDSTYHRVYVTECQNCHKDGNITHLQVHSGGTQGPTCTEGKICKKCGAEYDIPGHAWGEWKPNGDGTHTRRCTNPNCDAKEENVPCGGDSRATCIRPGTSVTTGASGHPPATAHTSATARTATKLILQAVPVAQQPAPPKRSVRRVVGNTAKKTSITMLWCIPMQKPPPVRKSAGTLTTSASAAAIPPAKSCPH